MSVVLMTSTVQRIRYLKGTFDLKLRYSKGNDDNFHAYSDADWASDVDKRRSCSGNAVMLMNGIISWDSKRQPIVALSSTEAEYISLSSVIREVIWLKQLSDEICPTLVKTTNVYCDNQSSIKLAKTDAFKPRTKHIDIRYHHIRDKISEGVIAVKYLPTEEMTADILTKALTSEKFEHCRNKMGFISLSGQE